MKSLLFFLVLLYTPSALASKDCNRYGILNTLIAYDTMTVQNKQYPMIYGMINDLSKVKQFTTDCPVIHLSPLAYDQKPADYYFDRNGILVLRTDYNKLIKLLTDFNAVLSDTKFNMSLKAGESISEAKRKASPDLDKQLVKRLTPVRPCNFYSFFGSFVNYKYTKASKPLQPPLPSYDGSSSEFISFKRDPDSIDSFLKDCPSISHNNKKYPITKPKLLALMTKIQTVHNDKPFKTVGYMGGTWNEGDYYMSSEEQLQDSIEYQFSLALKAL